MLESAPLEQELVLFVLGSPLFAQEIRLLVILGHRLQIYLDQVGNHLRGLDLLAHQPPTKTHLLFIALIQLALIMFHFYF